MNRSRQILITDNGLHPPDLWALATADHLVHLDLNKASPKEQRVVQHLEEAIVDVLVKHHERVQNDARGELQSHGDAAVRTEHDPSDYLDEAVADVLRAARSLRYSNDPELERFARKFETHFNLPEVKAQIRQIVGDHFVSAMHIEHSWYSGDQPGHAAHRKKFNMPEPGENARKFLAAHHSPIVQQEH